ncbi:MAG: TolC family protein [Candidatus Eisenbacteria bacterium]|nr:TolC family protein [Candidatus Eisenbacteria bacterium]
MRKTTSDARGRENRTALAVSLLLFFAFVLGCAHHPPSVRGVPGASPAPQIPWTPPRASAPSLAARAPEIPPELLSLAREWTLADIVDIALRNSAETREAWEDARSAAAAYGGSLADRYPSVHLGAEAARARTFSSDGSENDRETYGASADLAYLLYDFGGRGASIDESRQALLAAGWMHNAAIQDAALRVQQAYYGYVAAKALLEAKLSTLEEARVGFEAAEERHRSGLATIADVLQARTALSQAALAVEELRGETLTTRGVLATAMGLSANTDFDAALPPEELPSDPVLEGIDRYLEKALAARPDLAAARARALQARAHSRKVRADGLPRLTLSAGAERSYAGDPDEYDDIYRGLLSVRFPLFTGFSHRYARFEAEADAAAAEARLREAEQAVVLDVWTSYYDFRTAGTRVRASEDLVKSASESHDVALGRYRSGVGSVLDLMAAQSALENARAERVRARSDWFLSLARLTRAVGEPISSSAGARMEKETGAGKDE